MLEIIKVNIKDFHTSPIMTHKDFVRYTEADKNLQESSREIENVHGFLDGKAVVVVYNE